MYSARTPESDAIGFTWNSGLPNGAASTARCGGCTEPLTRDPGDRVHVEQRPRNHAATWAIGFTWNGLDVGGDGRACVDRRRAHWRCSLATRPILPWSIAAGRSRPTSDRKWVLSWLRSALGSRRF